MNYDRERSLYEQDCTEEMIRMRSSRGTGPHPDPASEAPEQIDSGWRWRTCRDIGIRIDFWPRPSSWALGFGSDADRHGGIWFLNLGPLIFAIQANAGTP